VRPNGTIVGSIASLVAELLLEVPAKFTPLVR
jgi:hypothetical protein